MKKLLLFILVPVVVVAGCGATVYFLARDNSTISYQASEKTTNQVITQDLMNAFSTTKEKHQIIYEMKQDDFNQIISLAYSSLDSNVKEYVKGIEIKIEGEEYHIYVYAKAWILPTKIDMTCKFSQDDSSYYLKVTNIKMGKLPDLTGVAFNIVNKAITDEKLNTMFSSCGINMKSDLGNKQFVYSKTDAKKDLQKLISDNMGSDALLSSAFNNLMEMDIISLDFTSSLKAIIDLQPLNTNEAFCSSSNMLSEESLALENNKEKLITLLNNNVIDQENNHPTTTFNYLLRGYDSLSSDEEKKYIDSIDLSSIGISDKENYEGYQPTKTNIKADILESTLTGGLLTDGVTISESTLNNYIKEQGILGYSYVMTYKTDDSYIVNYITLDNTYFNLTSIDGKEQMNMVIGLNINGYETSLILENTKKDTTQYGITLSNDNIYFGNKFINDELKTQIYSLIKDNLPTNEFMTFDGNGTFTLDFKNYLNTYILGLNIIKKDLKLDTSILGSSLEDSNAGISLKGSIISK